MNGGLLGIIGGLLGGGAPNQQGGIGTGLLNMDPEKLNQLALAASLLSGRKGDNWGRHFGDAAIRGQQIAEHKELSDLRKYQLEQRKQEAERQKQIDSLGPQFMRPGMAPDPYEFDQMGEGTPTPTATAPSFDVQGYTNALLPLDPQRALSMQSHLAQMNQRQGPIKVGNNERLVDPRTGRVTLDAAPDLPPGMVLGPSGPQYLPAYLEGQERIRAAGRQNTTVNMPAPEKAFNVELAKLDAKQLDDWRESATKAQGGLSRIHEMKKLTGDSLYSGWGAEGRLGVANFFATMGLPVDQGKIANSQEYLKHAKELTLTMLKEGVGASQISNADLAFVEATVPQLATNPQARVNLLSYMERRLGESVDRFQRADEYARGNNGLRGFRYGKDPRQPGQQGDKPAKLQKNLTALVKARQALKEGKPRELVIQRLIEQGYDPAGL